MDLTTPSGTKDFFDIDCVIRQHIFTTARKYFDEYGGKELDTPIFEYYKNIDNLYGDEFKDSVFLLNNDDNDNNTKLFLRYDLTVPLARFVNTHGLSLLKRYQIGKVYRKDTPSISKGRYREFYQCDFDIVGSDQKSGIYDIEIISLLQSILTDLLESNEEYTIEINYREILENIIKFCNVNDDNILKTIITLDKLDKYGWSSTIIEELKVNLTDESIDKLYKIYKDIEDIKPKYDLEKIYDYLKINMFVTNEIDELLITMIEFIKMMNYENIQFNPFLARGLNYYTGIVFEVKYINKKIMEFTIASGGRYDKMMSKFSPNPSIILPSIGMSLGVERLVKIIESNKTLMKKLEDGMKKKYEYKFYVATIGEYDKIMTPKITAKKLYIVNKLRNYGLKITYSNHKNPKMRQQLNYCFENNVKYMIVIGSTEIENNNLTLKNLNTKEQITMTENDIMEKCKLL